MGDTSERDSLKRIVSEKPNQQEVLRCDERFCQDAEIES